MNPYRNEVVQLYKTLLFLGREYPLGYPYFRERCHRAFMKNREERDPENIKRLLGHGEFVVKELTSLYFLKKYRTMKRRYYPEKEKELVERFRNIPDQPKEK